MAAPTIRAGDWQAAWSFNTTDGVADGMSMATLATEARTAMTALRATPLPRGGPNPETTSQGISLTGRTVVTITAWFRTTSLLPGHSYNQAMASAFKRALWASEFASGIDRGPQARQFDNGTVANALDSCTDAGVDFVDPARVGIGPIGTLIATACATFRTFEGPPPPPPEIAGTLGQLGAAPIRDSNNQRRIGESPIVHLPNPFGGDFGISKSTLTTVGIVAGVLVGLAVLGYALRPVVDLAKEVRG